MLKSPLRKLRERIRLAVHGALRARFPELVEIPLEQWSLPGNVQIIHDALDRLIMIARRTPPERRDTFAEQIRQQVCAGCDTQRCSGFCPLRDPRFCALQKSMPVVMQTIVEQLEAERALERNVS